MTAGMANLGQPKRPAASPADKENANAAKSMRVDGENEDDDDTEK